MSVRADPEEIETTRSERMLALALTAFIAIGGIWAYFELERSFALRLLLVVVMLGSGYWLLARMRRKRSRYLPVAIATIGAAVIVALVMAGDYTTEYMEFGELGPLALSITGIVLTLAAFVALQRYLSKRLPMRRVRRQECPFCGFPVHANANCEGCGRRVIGECSTCHQARRVGTQHCGACGAM